MQLDGKPRRPQATISRSACAPRREDEPRQKRDELIRNHELADLELQIAGVGQSAA